MRRAVSAVVAALCGTAADAPAADEAHVLHLANRPEFIADDTVQRFEAETGIAVIYDVYPRDEALLEALRAGNPRRWDLVVAAAVPVLARGIAEGLFQPVEPETLGNYGNLDPWILSRLAVLDPDNRIAVPYLWSTDGLAINATRLAAADPDAPADSLALVFDPLAAERAGACGVVMEDAPEDAFPAALAWLGLDPDSREPHDLDRVGDLLARLKPLVRRLDDGDFVEALASGAACVGFGSSTEIGEAKSRAEQRATGVTLGYVIPKEPGRMRIDVMAIPAGAAHPDAARAFIDFILRPEIISDITDWTAAANPNLLAADFVDDDDKGDETVFPSEASRARLLLGRPLPPEAAAQRARIWARTQP
jgi:putrescine transport system substrate-binding protein